MGNSESHETNDSVQASDSRGTANAENFQRDVDFGKAGDDSSNQEWRQMSGSPQANSQTNADHIDFGAHQDIYASNASNMGQSESQAGRGGQGELQLQQGQQKGSDAAENAQFANQNNPTSPDAQLPTPEQLRDAPIEQLQEIANQSRNSLVNQVENNPLPDLALHGTSPGSGKALSEQKQQGTDEIWVAGQSPDRKGLGVEQQIGDLSASWGYAKGFADKRDKGPVLIYDATNQPEAWGKTDGSNHGSIWDGHNPEDTGKHGKLKLAEGNLLGQVPREKIDGLDRQFAPLDSALKDKQSEILKDSPGQPDPAKVKDLNDRVIVMNRLKRDHEIRMILDASKNNMF